MTKNYRIQIIPFFFIVEYPNDFQYKKELIEIINPDNPFYYSAHS